MGHGIALFGRRDDDDDSADNDDDDSADDDDDDAVDDIVADTCSLGLLQRRPGGQQIVADKKKRLSLLHWLNCVHQQTNKQINKLNNFEFSSIIFLPLFAQSLKF